MSRDGKEEDWKGTWKEMTETLILALTSGGLNVVIIGAILWNTRKVSKLEGTLNNGAFLKCPFYKKKVDNAVSCDNGKATDNERKNSQTTTSCK